MSRGPQRICIDPIAGCDEIFDARSSASAEGMAGDMTEPGVGMVYAVEGFGSIGRRDERRDMAREAEGVARLLHDQRVVAMAGNGWGAHRGAAAEGLRRPMGAAEGRATARRQRRAFIVRVPAWEDVCKAEVVVVMFVRWTINPSSFLAEVQRACRRKRAVHQKKAVAT